MSIEADGLCDECVEYMNEDVKQFMEVTKAKPEEIKDFVLLPAAESGHKPCVERLIRAGADVNPTDHRNATALWNAAWQGSDACVNSLIKAGASVNKPSDRGRSPLAIAAEMGHVECVKL